MELFTADDFPGDLTLFPQPTDLLFRDRTAVVHSHHSSVIEHRSLPPPPQKLRPIRGIGKAPAEYSESPANLPAPQLLENGDFSDAQLDCQNLDFVELGFLSHHHNLSPFDGDPMGCSDSLAAQSLDSSGCIFSGNGFPKAEIRVAPSQVKLEVDAQDMPEGFISENESGSLSAEGADTSEDYMGSVNQKRKRKTSTKMEHYVEKLMMKVIKKQELMHKQLIGMIEKMERERIQREEAWMEEQIKRAKRDELVRTQERSRNLALISFIQKAFSQQIQIPHSLDMSCIAEEEEVVKCEIDCQKELLKGDPSNKRWTKSEARALVTLRTGMEEKFRGEGLIKRLLWEEVSSGLLDMGYSRRTARQCSEKWENINKYFKKAIGSSSSSKKRPNCPPYFHEFDSLYRNGLFDSENAPTNSRRINEGGKE